MADGDEEDFDAEAQTGSNSEWNPIQKMVASNLFDWTMLAVVIVNCVVLALEPPNIVNHFVLSFLSIKYHTNIGYLLFILRTEYRFRCECRQNHPNLK